MNFRRQRNPGRTAGQSHGLARVLSKLGYCSRSQAWKLIQAGRVTVDGVMRRNPEWPVVPGAHHLEVDGLPVRDEGKIYLMLNKPRGLVTTAADEHGRPTVFQCLVGHGLPVVAPVGRLDQASEGLLLFTNDSAWAASITDPLSRLEKIYHVQVDTLADEALTRSLQEGRTSDGELLKAKRATMLRHGQQNSWLEIVLDEGRNRHIRRLLAALDIQVLRLIRVAIGPLALGALAKCQFRHLTPAEVQALKLPNRSSA